MTIILDAINALFYAIVEGITEWLPISSTGHLILYENFFPFSYNVSNEFMGMFEYLIQLAAILAIVCLFFNRLNPFSRKIIYEERKDIWQLWFKVVFACLPAIVAYLLFNDIIELYLETPVSIAIMLVVYGILFIIVENLFEKGTLKTKVETIDNLSYKTAFLIGCFQVLSIIPGTSRSGATILGAMILCCSRTVSAEFSFFLAIPAMVGTSALKCLDLFLENGVNFSINEIIVMIIGMVAAFVVSLLCAKFLMNFIKKHSFKIFGYYRIILGVILLIIFNTVL
ncbi:MAG: undecaprenyl-diphosphate phosphatase [Clostridia bacterium]|nr:undecaprenyl-diphosphate phosphatase [Clostridia bacterium]